MLLWVEDYTDRRVDLGFWQGEIPTTWFLALNPLMIFVFTPILIKLWAWQARLRSRDVDHRQDGVRLRLRVGSPMS